MWFALVTLPVLLGLPPMPGPGDLICGPRAAVISTFNTRYGHARITSRHRQQSTTVEILHAPETRTWAVMGENYRGETCVRVRQSDGAVEMVIGRGDLGPAKTG